MRRAATAVLCVVTAILPAFGRDTLPRACTIPATFAASLPPAAAARRDAADKERTTLSNQIASFESQCRGVPKKTPAYDSCVALSGVVDSSISAYLRLLEDNQAALRAEVAAVRRHAVTRVAELDRKIPETRAKLAVDGKRITGIEAAAKEWEDASEDARLQTRKIALGVYFDTIIDASLLRLTNNRAAQIALDQREIAIVQRTIGELSLPMGGRFTKPQLDALLDWKEYFVVRGPTLLLRIDRNTDRLHLLKALGEFNKVLDAVDAANALDGPEEREAILRSYIATLKVGLSDPALKAIVNQWDLNISLWYLFRTDSEAEKRVDQLSALGTKSLEGIAALSRLHKAQIDERAAIRRLTATPDLTSASGCPF